jgi:hypothetical protein
MAARRARAAELERMAGELDPNVSRRQRAIVILGTAVVGIALSVIAIVTRAEDVSPRSLLLQSLVPSGVYLLLALLWWRRHAQKQFNRRAAFCGATLIFGITLSRLFGLWAGMASPHILLHDMMLGAATCMMASVLVIDQLAWAGLFMLVAAAYVALHPEHAMLGFSLSSGFALVVVAGFAWRRR